MILIPLSLRSFRFFLTSLLLPAAYFHLPTRTKSRIVFGRAGAEFPGAAGCRLGGHSEVLARPRRADRCRQDCPSVAARGLLIGAESRHSSRRRVWEEAGRVGEGSGRVTSRHQEARLWFYKMLGQQGSLEPQSWSVARLGAGT